MELGSVYDKLASRLNDGDIDRRTFLRSLGLLAASCGVVGTATSLFPTRAFAQGAETIKMNGYGSGNAITQAWVNELIPRFTAETGVEVELGSFTGLDAFLTQVMMGNPSDYNFFPVPEPRVALDFQAQDLLEEVDDTQIPRLSTIMTRAVDEYRKYSRGGGLIGVPYNLNGNWIAYNTGEVTEDEMNEKGYNILLDPSYRGRISGEDGWDMRIWYAALQSGQDPNDITDMGAVWDKVLESRGNVLKYWNTGAEGSALLASGEVIINDFRLSPTAALKRQGVPVEGWPRSGTVVGLAGLAAIKGSPMERFYELLDIALRPEVQIALALHTGNVTLLNPQLVELPPEIQQMVGFDPTGTMEDYNFADPVYWSDHSVEWQQEYVRVMARG